MKELLITSGYPRSGNTYLNQALNLLYYPKELSNNNRHTVMAIENATKIIVAFRNPVDAVASWHNYPGDSELEADVKFYIRFHSAVLDNLSKVVLMDFNYFTKDINYIKNKVLKNFNIETNCFVTDLEVKEVMLANGKKINLPTQNEEQLLETKTLLPKVFSFEKCLMLYDKLIEQSL